MWRACSSKTLMNVQVKICGFTEPDTLRVAAGAGADWIGLNFFPASPRYVTPAAAASLLMHAGEAIPVALMADADDALIDEIAGVGFPVLQLHGAESPERVAEIKARTGLEVWKALGISTSDDIARAETYAGAADRLLLDAKPPKGADLPGGRGEVFDWSLLKAWRPPLSWLLAGGLTPDNVASAITATGARAVDVASGVEVTRGLKSAQRIRDFISAAKDPA